MYAALICVITDNIGKRNIFTSQHDMWWWLHV